MRDIERQKQIDDIMYLHCKQLVNMLILLIAHMICHDIKA